MVRVALPGGAYDVQIGDGILDDLGDLLRRHCPAAHYAVITDSDVGPLYAERARAAASRAGPAAGLSFPSGEARKTRETWSALTDQLLATGLGRDGAIVALGGGVVGDVAGFVAATYLRGIPVVQAPTTLLAMIDSSVGGKTGVDTPAGKNLVGAFHQPRLVVADVSTLKTLPARELAAGLAEALKHGAIADRKYFDELIADRDQLLAGDPESLTRAVAASVRIKAEVVAQDEREQGPRAMLNFGHTIGHAVEAASEYRLLHGQAISIGMVAEAALGAELGVTDKSVADLLRTALERFGLPTAIPQGMDSARVLAFMRHDKKARGNEIRFSLIEKIGKFASGSDGQWTIRVKDDTIAQVLRRTS